MCVFQGGRERGREGGREDANLCGCAHMNICSCLTQGTAQAAQQRLNIARAAAAPVHKGSEQRSKERPWIALPP